MQFIDTDVKHMTLFIVWRIFYFVHIWCCDVVRSL